MFKRINKQEYLSIVKSFIASQKKLHQWWHMCAHNESCGLVRAYIPYYIGSEDRSRRSQIFFKVGVLKNFTDFTGKHLCWSVFLIKLKAFRPATLLKKTPTQVLCCEICETYKNTYPYRTPPVALPLKRSFPQKSKHSKTRLNEKNTYQDVLMISFIISIFPQQYLRCCPTW